MEVLETLLANLTTLASVYHKPPEYVRLSNITLDLNLEHPMVS